MKLPFKLPQISPISRISFGLLLLTISLLLLGDMVGVVPNQQEAEVSSRKVIAESLAIQISSEIGDNRIKKAKELLKIIVRRNDNIQSIALINSNNEVVVKSMNHNIYWQGKEGDSSTANDLKVPIYKGSTRWGRLEVSFVPIGTIWNNMFTSHSFSAMLLFIIFFGAISYWIFLKRALSELDPSSVIPDRVRSALDVLNEGLIIIDNSERIVLMNDAIKKKLSVNESDFIGKRLSSFIWKKEDNSIVEKQMLPWNILMETEIAPTLKTLQLNNMSSNELLTFSVNTSAIKTPNQKIKGMIVTIDDITEVEKKNKQLIHILGRLEKSKDEISRQNKELLNLSVRDPLTNLFNRRALFNNLKTMLNETKENNYFLSCIMLDIDFFKSINDTYGHSVGDKVICTIAEILQSVTGQNDIASRYGGEEFVIVLPGTKISDAMILAEKIRKTISEYTFDEIDKGLKVTSSFGVSSIVEGKVLNADVFVDQADQALYKAKQTGRNKVVSYDGSILVTKSENLNDYPTIRNKNRTIKKDKSSTNNIEICDDASYSIIIDRLTQAKKMAQRDKKHLAVLNIFVDSIQLANNALGHSIANKLKKIAYERIAHTFRVSDSIIAMENIKEYMSLSRLSDSEFVVILSRVKEDKDITWVILRMMQELSTPADVDGHEIVMTANIGISAYPIDGSSADGLLNNAKIALSKAREKGRGEFLFYNKEMNHFSKEALKIESQLHLALKRKELYLNFQPITNLQTGVIEKVETLLRWKHPELGMVSPDLFIEIAEHAGSIKAIGSWVVEQACRQLYRWQQGDFPNLIITINVSAVQFYYENFVQNIIDIVKQEKVSPESIVFELTETALLKEHNYISETIHKLHSTGFKIALDDFGTGYSSLSYLKKFPIDIIKIDRSLMEDFPENVNSISIVSGLIGLCHNLGMEVVCEGVEKKEQLKMLHKLMCDSVQGYYLSEALSAEKMTTLFKSSSIRQCIRKATLENKRSSTLLEDSSFSSILNTPPL